MNEFLGSMEITARNCNLYYGDFHALKNINIEIPEKQVTALIGPSGCGKSTFLKIFNRMNDLVEGCRIEGEFHIGGVDIFDKETDVNILRKNVGMVFQKPNPFPMSIYDNIAFAPRTFLSSSISSSILPVEMGSSAEVGSSIKSTLGLAARERAMQSLCC